MRISLKMHGLKVMTINTFHSDPRPSLWISREPEDKSHIERGHRLLPRQRKRTSKLLLSKNLLALS